MNVIKCDCSNGFNPDCEKAVSAAVKDLSDGKLVVYPTETVYGIGADIYNEKAIKNLYLAKNRPFDMALSVAVYDRSSIEEIAYIDEVAEKLINAFMPGPLTLIIPKQSVVPELLTSMSQRVGIRIPDHPIAREIAKRQGPIVATSANLHSRPDALSVDEAIPQFGESVSTYIDCGRSQLGKPSTIVWVVDGQVEIIRQGLISAEQINEALQC